MKEHTLNVRGEEIVLSHKRFMQMVSDGTKVRCQCGECIRCKAVKQQQRNIAEEACSARAYYEHYK